MSHAPGKWKEPGLMFCLLESSDQQSREAKEIAEQLFEGEDVDSSSTQGTNSLWQVKLSSKSPQSQGHVALMPQPWKHREILGIF